MFVNSIVPDLKVLVHPLMGASLNLAHSLCHGQMQAGTGEQNMLDIQWTQGESSHAWSSGICSRKGALHA